MNTAKKQTGQGIKQVELLNYLLNNLQQFNLKPTTKLVLLYLAGCYNPRHADVFPKQKTIALQMGISEASVIRAIQELHKEGLIISERKFTNRYKFTSRILTLGKAEETFSCDQEMQVETSQKVTSETSNLQASYNRTTIEQEKNNSEENKVSIEEFKILKDYAVQKGAKNVARYVEALKRNGSAEKILLEAKQKEACERYWKQQIEKTREITSQPVGQGVKPTTCDAILQFKKLHGLL